MKKYIQEIIDEYDVQGLIAVAFNSDGEILYEDTFGYRDVAKKEMIDKNTVFGIASMSKSFTALAIMQLVEQGIISLEAPVKNYIPELQNKNHETVLVKHLLTHAGGYFPQHRTTVYEMAEELQLDLKITGDLSYSAELAEAGAKRVAALFDAQTIFCGKPGERLSYSNDSYGLLTEMIRRNGGESSYTDYVQKHVFAPLGMTRTTVAFDVLKDMDNVTKLYYKENNEIQVTTDFYSNSFVLLGGGGIKSTITDLIKYVTLYLNNGGDVINDDSLKQMTEPIIQYTLDSDYGYGLSVAKFGDQTVIGHGGSLIGVSSDMLWLPEKNLGVLVLCNTSDVPVSLISKKIVELIADIHPAEQTYSKKEWTDAERKAVVGSYHSDEGDDVEIVLLSNDTLSIKINQATKEYILGKHKVIYIKNKFSTGSLIFYTDEEAKIFAVKHGGRILMKNQI